jgi:lysophospholipase L1-like esterase
MQHPDARSTPFTTLVALGESTVAGACASEERFRWVNVVADLAAEFQGQPLTLHNKGIGANAVSPRSPGYERSAKPSALERYHDDVIALEPDLFILSYGLNDMRAGMHPEEFREDMQRIISDVAAACAPVTVLTTVYHMSAYDLYPPYDQGSPEAARVYNEVIKQLAEANACLLADIYEAEGGADWVVHSDTVHANDLGHRLIGHRVFEVIATNCSGVAAGVTAKLREAAAQVARTMDERRSPQNYDR